MKELVKNFLHSTLSFRTSKYYSKADLRHDFRIDDYRISRSINKMTENLFITVSSLSFKCKVVVEILPLKIFFNHHFCVFYGNGKNKLPNVSCTERTWFLRRHFSHFRSLPQLVQIIDVSAAAYFRTTIVFFHMKQSSSAHPYHKLMISKINCFLSSAKFWKWCYNLTKETKHWTSVVME